MVGLTLPKMIVLAQQRYIQTSVTGLDVWPFYKPMNLTINVDATDKRFAAVESATDRTAVSELESLTIGNKEPFTVSFCDDAGATPAFVTDADTVVAVGLGRQDINGGELFASIATLTVSGSTRVGLLDMDQTALRQAAWTDWGCWARGFRGIFLTLEIRRVTTVTGSVTAAETLALLQVFCAAPVMPAP